MEKVAVLGAGSWGSALANLLAKKGGYRVNLWVRRKKLLKDLNKYRENRVYLPGIILDENIYPTGSLKEALCEASTVINAIPSHGVRDIFSRVADYIEKEILIVSASKGIEEKTLLTVSQVLKTMLPAAYQTKIAVLSGPSFAKEVALGLPAAVCVSAEDKGVAEEAQRIFSTPKFRVYTNMDTLGVELGGATKNVIAIAAGINDGLDLGTNARAALITRGLAEITRLGVAMGARQQTFYGLAGLGDLVLTCTGALSRNRFVGVSIGKGKKLEDIMKGMNMVAEGIKTSRAIRSLAKRYDVDMPITKKIYEVLYKDKSARDAVVELMARELKEE